MQKGYTNHNATGSSGCDLYYLVNSACRHAAHRASAVARPRPCCGASSRPPPSRQRAGAGCCRLRRRRRPASSAPVRSRCGSWRAKPSTAHWPVGTACRRTELRARRDWKMQASLTGSQNISAEKTCWESAAAVRPQRPGRFQKVGIGQQVHLSGGRALRGAGTTATAGEAPGGCGMPRPSRPHCRQPKARPPQLHSAVCCLLQHALRLQCRVGHCCDGHPTTCCGQSQIHVTCNCR